MPVAVTVTIDTREMKRTLDRLRLDRSEGQRAMERALDKVSFMVQENAASKQIIRGGSGPPHPTRLTSRTGTLRRSIRVNRRGPLIRDVGTDLVYGAVHELGGRFHPPRPYLAPALREVQPKASGIFARELVRLIGKP